MPSLSQIGSQTLRKSLPLALAGAASLMLGGCLPQVAGIKCSKVQSNTVHVGRDQTCKFAYGHGDMAKYVVKVTQPARHGQASGDGKYLKYVAKPGFVGEDVVKIKVERWGIGGLGHLQWENLTVKVKVGAPA